jgi:hypothetical protein
MAAVINVPRDSMAATRLDFGVTSGYQIAELIEGAL